MAIIKQFPTVAGLAPDTPARTRILTAAMEILHTDGFAALTQTQVAHRAGVRQSHVTYYFPTRNDLLRATAQFGFSCMMEPLDQRTGQAPFTLAEFKVLLMPEPCDRSWSRLMNGLHAAGSEDSEIAQWLQEFDRQAIGRIQNGFAAVGYRISDDAMHVLHCVYVGSLHLESSIQTPESFERAQRVFLMAFDYVVSTAQLIPQGTAHHLGDHAS